MLAAALALALAPQTTSILIDDPAGEEGRSWAWLGAFDPTRNAFWLSNCDLVEGAPSRFTAMDLGSGAVGQFADAPDQAFQVAVTPDGSTLVGLGFNGETRIVDLTTGALRASLPGSYFGNGGLDLDSTGARAMVFSSCSARDVTVLDLGAATIEREFTLPFAPTCFTDSFLAGDDVTLVTAGGPGLAMVDTLTELQTGQAVLPGDTAFALEHDATKNVAVLFAYRGGGNVVTSVDVATQAALGRRFVPGEPISFGALGQAVDDAGTRAIFNSLEGPVLVDLAASTWDRLTIEPGVVGLTHDGLRAFVITTSGLELYDAQTAQLISVTELPGRGRRNGIVRHPSLDLFAVDVEQRVEFIDLSGPAPTVLDASPNVGPDADGPFAMAVDPTGLTAAVTARGSYDLRLLSLETESVLARVDVAAQPVDVAYTNDGGLLVAHGAAKQVTEHDPATLAELSVIPIPGRAIQMWTGNDPNIAWLHVQGSAGRLMVRINRASQSVDRSIALRAGADPALGLLSFFETSLRPKVALDLSRGLVYALHQTVGVLDTHELQTGQLVSSVPVAVGESLDGALALSPRFDALAHQGGDVCTVYDLSTAGPTVRWQAPTCSRIEAIVPAWLGNDVVTVNCTVGDFWEAATGAVIGGSQGALHTYDGQINDGRTWAVVQNFTPVGEGVFLTRLAPSGQTEQIGFIPLSRDGEEPSDLILEPVTGAPILLGAGPGGTGVHLLDFAPAPPQRSCSPAALNANGTRATIEVEGMFSAGSSLTVRTSGLEPGGMPSLLLVSSDVGPPRPLLISGRSLCVAGAVGRFNGQVGVANAAGVRSVGVRTGILPIPGLTVAQPGTSWTFQTWYRDRTQAGAPTDNASDSVTVVLR